MYMLFSFFSLKTQLFGIYQTSFLPVDALEFSELKTSLVYTFVTPKHEASWRNLPLETRVLHSTQWHTVAVTPVALHSVAHTMSQQILAILEMSRYIPQKLTLSHLSCHHSVTVSRGSLLAKTDRATRGCSTYTHTNRATLCH